jgi:DNA polymerase elongation subunit (family B)
MQTNEMGGRTKLYGTPVGAKTQKDSVMLNTDHFPYFYSLEAQDGKTVKECVPKKMKLLSTGEMKDIYQVYTYYKGTVPKISSDADFENHIPYTTRFIMDEGVKHDDKMPTVLTYDIECLPKDEFSFPTPAKDKIISIAAKFGDEEVVFLDEDEEEILLNFQAFIDKCNPDLICSYNGDNFDNRYIEKRRELHNVSEMFSRFGNTYPVEREDTRTGKKYVRWFFPGRVNFDVILPVFADQSLNAKTKGRGLKAVGKYFFERGDISYKPIELEESIHLLWENKEYDKIREYNLRDVQCTHDICTKIYLPQIIELAKLLECDLQTACYYTQYWLHEVVMGKKYNHETVLCDLKNEDRFINVFNAIQKGTGKVQGALAGIGERGFYWNPYKLDYVGYYPAIDRKYGISPENCELMKITEYSEDGYKCIDRKDCYIFCIPDGNCRKNFIIKVDKIKRGYLPQVEDKLYEMRLEIKAEKKKGVVGAVSRDWGIKVVMNALIGSQALPYTTKGSILCSILILGIARENTRLALEISKNMGATICNYDTDGVLLANHYDSQSIVDEVQKQTGLELDHEASYEYAFIYKAKSYVVNYKGENIVHGVPLKSKDKPNMIDKLLEELINLLVKNYDTNDRVDKIMRFLLDIDVLDQNRFIPTDYVINKTLQKDIGDYVANTPQKRVGEEMRRRGSDVSAGTELSYFWGLFADENKNVVRTELYKDKKNQPKKRKIMSDAMPMISEDWKLISFELTDLVSKVDTFMKFNRMKTRWMSFYKEISQYLRQKDYAELAQEIGKQEWESTCYYYNKMYSKMNMMKIFKLVKSRVPPSQFFTDFFEYLEDNYPDEDEFAKFFEELCGVSAIDIENIDLIDNEIATIEMQKQDIIANLDEKYNLDWYSDRYNVDALVISVKKYVKLVADVLSRILSAFFALKEVDSKDVELNSMGYRIRDLLLRKDKVQGTSLPIDEVVKRKLILWKDHRGLTPELDVSSKKTLDDYNEKT